MDSPKIQRVFSAPYRPRVQTPTVGAATPTDLGRGTSLSAALGDVCKLAVDLLGVDHSAFVRFDSTLTDGFVAAHYPEAGFEGLLNAHIPLRGVPAEESLLAGDDVLEIVDVENSDSELGQTADLLRQFKIKSLYIVKVKAHGQIIGSFSFDSVSVRRFGTRERSTCASVAKLAAVLIENTLLLDWLDAFGRATETMISNRSKSLPSDIASLAARLFDVQEAGLYELRHDADGEFLALVASTVPRNHTTLRRSDKGMAWQLIDGNASYLECPDYSKYEHRSQLLDGQFASVLEVPMIWRNERVGVFFLHDKLGRQFSQFSADLLTRFADMSTLALQRSRLLDRVQRLSDASADYSQGTIRDNLVSQLKHIAVHAASIVDAEMCGVFRLKELASHTVLSLEASAGHRENSEGVDRTPFLVKDELGSGLTGAVAHRLRSQFEDMYARSVGSHSPLMFERHGEALRNDPAVRGEADASRSSKCHSLLVVPLVVKSRDGDRFIGILRMSNKLGAGGVPSDAYSFSDEDVWILSILGHSAAVAIESAEMHQRLRRTGDAVSIVAVDLAGGDEDTALQNVVDGVKVATQCDVVTLVTIRTHVGSLVLRQTDDGRQSETPPQLAWPGSHYSTVIGKLLKHPAFPKDGTMYVAENAANDSVMQGPFVEREGIRSSAAIPLWVQIHNSTTSRRLDLARGSGENSLACVGVLFVNYRRAYRFTGEDRAVIEPLARLAALAIHNQHLYDEKVDEIKVQQALYEAARALSESLELTTTYQRIADTAHAVALAAGIRVTFVDVVICNEESNQVVAACPIEMFADIVVRVDRTKGSRWGLVTSALESGKTVVENYVKKSADYLEGDSSTQSELVEPILLDGHPVGTINVESSEINGIDSTAVHAFKMLAHLASDAIRNSAQYDLLLKAREREKHLSNVTFHYIKAGVIAHQHSGSVRTLGRVVGNLRNVAVTASVPLNVLNAIEEVQQRTGELERLLNSVRYEPGRWRAVRLTEVLEEFREEIRTKKGFVDLRFRLDVTDVVGFLVPLDRDMFKWVLHILCDNSLAAKKLDVDLTIQMVATTEPDGSCRILVADNGSGMEAETWAKVLIANVDTGVGGSGGIGLLTAALIIAKSGGRIEKVTCDERGTSFAIYLPAPVRRRTAQP